MFGICNLSIIPCRAEPSDKSEMVTQLLFGESFQIIKEQNQWRFIRSAFDNYEGWIDKKQFLSVSEETYNELQAAPIYYSTDLINVITQKETNAAMPIVIGSSLPLFENEICNLEGNEYSFQGQTVNSSATIDREKLIENAYTYLNAPYLWGGRSPFGIDCSGLTQMVYKLAGIVLPRDAYQQAEIGQTLSFLEEAQIGDLAFFDNTDGHIIHTGIILKNNLIIHASGKVRIDRFDHQGIYNAENRIYSHNLRLIKKII